VTLGANPSGGTSGDLGWSSGTWEVKDNAGKVVDSGWYFSVSKKKAGKWLSWTASLLRLQGQGGLG
jgi:hypothetical protein